MNKKVHIIGGGTFSYVRNHLALAMPAFGTTARALKDICEQTFKGMDVELTLTKMADSSSDIITNENVSNWADSVINDPTSKIVFFNAGITDFDGKIDGIKGDKYGQRLDSSDSYKMNLYPNEKILRNFRFYPKGRKDLFLVAFKTTCGATAQEQYLAGLNLLKANSCNLVLANDVKTRWNMVICPEEAVYHETMDREEALRGLAEMTYLRSHLTFTRSTVVAGDPIEWESELVPDVLRKVVDYCIQRGAYKRFRGVTAGHFACKLSDTEFLTSRRKTDFNDMKNVGLVKIKTDGPDSVIAYGSKPSVGGQSQRIVFTNHPEYDCILHFHCPIKKGSEVPVASQREYECGSHQCGSSTSRNLKQFGNLSAVYLDQHGPNIVFHHSIDPQEVIEFIEENFNLEEKTGGYQIS